MSDEKRISLRVGKADLAAMITKGAVGPLPIIGPLAAEVLGNVIPNQRLDRMAALLTRLDERVAAVESDSLKSRFSDAEFVDLLEEAMVQASRARSDERIGYIAEILKRGLTAEDRGMAGHARLMGLLGQINDPEVVLLRGHAPLPKPDLEFLEKHQDTLRRPHPSFAGPDPSTHEAAAIHDSYVDHLVNLGLLKNEYGELRYDSKVKDILKPKRRRITRLGEMLLREIGMLDSE